MSESKLPLVRVQLMGPQLIAQANGQPVVFRYEKLKALLAYLCSHPDRAHPRAELAQLLWPTSSDTAALNNLRRAVFDLRKVFDSLGLDCPVASDRRVVRWLQVPGIAVEHPSDAPLDTPVAFLPDLWLDDSPAWQTWLQAQRSSALQARLDRLDTLVAGCERRGDLSGAIGLAEQRCQLTPDDEGAHRALIRLLMQSGQLDRAKDVFHACQAQLSRLGTRGIEASTEALGRALMQASEQSDITPGRGPLTLLVVHQCNPDGAAAPEGEPGLQASVNQMGGQLVRLSQRLLVASFGGLKALEHTPQRAWEALRRQRHTQTERAWRGWQAAIVHRNTQLAPGYPTPDASGEALSEALSLVLSAPPGTLVLNPAARLMLRRDLPRPACGAEPDLARHALSRLPALRPNAAFGPWLNDTGTPPIGRQQELSELLNWCSMTADHRQRRLHVEADAGVGKTRLLRHVALRMQERGSRVLLIQSDPLLRHHPWSALKQAVQDLVRDDAEAPEPSRIRRLRRTWRSALPAASRGWASLTRLLELPSPLDDSGLAADAQRSLMEQGLIDLLQRWCGPRDLLLVIEDTHWLDAATWQAVVRLSELPSWPPNWKVISSARTGEGPGPVSHQVELAPLSAADTMALAHEIAASAQVHLGKDDLLSLVRRAEGVPLFIDQLIHARLEPSHEPAFAPPSLHELLLTRMRGLGPLLRLAQAAACTGRVIDLPLLRWQQRVSDAQLMIGLEALQRAGMVQGGGQHWSFRHALIQEAAQATLAVPDRQRIHQQLADILRSRAPERIKEAPERLAQHLHEAGSPDASAAWLAAARHFSRRSETAAARHHLQQGLDALPWLRDEAARQDMAFRLWVETGHTLVALQGYGSEGSRQAYANALALADRVSDEGDLFQLMWGMWLGSRTVDEQAPPMAFAERLERAARDSTDPGVRLQVNYAFGNNHFWLAQYRPARQRLQAAVALASQVDSAQMIALYGEASHVCALAFLSWIDWIEGNSEQALLRSAEAVAQGRRSGHAHTLCFALAFAATLNRYLDRAEEAAALAATLASLASEHRLGLWQATAAAVAGWAQARRGDPAGLTPIRMGLAGAQQAMAAVETTFQAFLADALVHLQQWDEALCVIDEGLRTAHAIPDTYLLPELMRLRAHALRALHPTDPSACQACLQAAMAIAQEQGAIALVRKIELSQQALLG